MASTGELRVKAESSKSDPTSLFCKEAVVEPQKLVSGCVWVRSKNKESVQTLHAKAESPQAQFFIEYKDNKVYFSNHVGLLKLTFRDGRTLSLPAGFSVWISEIQADKKNLIGVLEPIELKSHLQKLGAIWEGPAQDLKTEMQPLVRRWGVTQEIAASYYESLVARRIASIEEAKNQEKSRILKKQLERQKNQKILFDRVFNR